MKREVIEALLEDERSVHYVDMLRILQGMDIGIDATQLARLLYTGCAADGDLIRNEVAATPHPDSSPIASVKAVQPERGGQKGGLNAAEPRDQDGEEEVGEREGQEERQAKEVRITAPKRHQSRRRGCYTGRISGGDASEASLGGRILFKEASLRAMSFLLRAKELLHLAVLRMRRNYVAFTLRHLRRGMYPMHLTQRGDIHAYFSAPSCRVDQGILRPFPTLHILFIIDLHRARERYQKPEDVEERESVDAAASRRWASQWHKQHTAILVLAHAAGVVKRNRLHSSVRVWRVRAADLPQSQAEKQLRWGYSVRKCIRQLRHLKKHRLCKVVTAWHGSMERGTLAAERESRSKEMKKKGKKQKAKLEMQLEELEQNEKSLLQKYEARKAGMLEVQRKATIQMEQEIAAASQVEREAKMLKVGARLVGGVLGRWIDCATIRLLGVWRGHWIMGR